MDYIMAAGLLFVGWVVQEFGDLFRKKGHYGKSPEYKDTYFRGELTWGGRFICAVGSGIMATGAGFLVIFVISLAGCAITMGDLDVDSSNSINSVVSPIIGIIYGLWKFFFDPET